jgi:sugar phosphate permease
VPYRHLLTCGTVLGALILGFSAYSLLSLNVVWLPAYLAESLGYGPVAAGWIVTLPSLCLIVILPAICAVSERLEQLGASSRFARGWLSSLCVMTAGLATIALPLSSGHALPIACVAIAFSIGNVIFALGHIMVAEVTPVRQRGAMLGIYNAVVTLAGPLAPVAMGLLVDVGASPADGFRTGFIVAGSVVTVGGFAGLLLMNPEADRAALFRQGRADAGVLWQ